MLHVAELHILKCDRKCIFPYKLNVYIDLLASKSANSSLIKTDEIFDYTDAER